jgi:hypothetical protein
MSQNLPDWFVDKWSDEVKLRAQQQTTSLHQYADNAGVFTGDHMYVPRIGSVDAVEVARLQQLANTSPPLDWVSVLCKPKFLPLMIWDPDINKLTIPVVQKMTKAVSAGMARSQDAMVRDAINTAIVSGVTGVRGPSTDATPAPATENITTIGDYNTIADLDTIAQAVAVLGSNYEFEGEDVTVCMPFKLGVNMTLDPYMAKNDVKIDWLNKLKFTTYEKLYDNAGVPFNAASTGADILMFARSAVTSAYNDEIKDINERLGNIMANMFGQWYQGGAMVSEPKGVLRIKTKTNFTIARKPIPVADQGPF